MNILLTVKKVGNHWYPNITHDDPIDIILDPKMEKLCSLLDKNHNESLTFSITEVHSWLEPNTIQFNDDDIWKWLHTDSTFTMKIFIDDHEFEISSLLIDLFEEQFDTKFYKNLYCINLYN